MTSRTIASCLQCVSQLAAVSDSPRLDVEIILAHLLQKSRTYLFAWPEQPLTEAQATLFDALFARRLRGEPVAHIVGVREFWSLQFKVDSSTLIPRPDTELLVETALGLFAEDRKNTLRRLLDLGTGTGAIALALASERPSWQCLAVDKELAAVALAEKNRAEFKLNNVIVRQSDWFSAVAAAPAFDIIVSNPPYIDPQDPHLTQGDVRFEPLSALIADNKGLADLELIIATAVNYLLPGAWLLLEHGYDQGAAVRDLFRAQQYREIKTLRDFGGNERVTLGQKN
ncbi:MAG TPA: peptide chain release factor N(5)-glutamine methyltransferase [Cellvibrio sp.]|nr:peptide chain release factor N(5)-glutamine methyltransferase [Cellvibrio sp.]